MTFSFSGVSSKYNTFLPVYGVISPSHPCPEDDVSSTCTASGTFAFPPGPNRTHLDRGTDQATTPTIVPCATWACQHRTCLRYFHRRCERSFAPPPLLEIRSPNPSRRASRQTGPAIRLRPPRFLQLLNPSTRRQHRRELELARLG